MMRQAVNASIKPFADPPERSPRVLFVGDHFGHPGGVVHGVTTYYRTVLPGLVRHGVAARLCLLGPVHPAAAALPTDHVAPIFCNRGKWDPRAALDLSRLIRQLDVDILHLSNIKAISLGCLLAPRAGVSTVLHFHDRVPPPAPLLHIMRHFARRAGAVIAISDSVRAFVATTYGLPPAQIAVLHYGVDLGAARSPSADERTSQRVRLGLADSAPVIAIVGRIAPEKRQALLIRIMPAVLQARPDTVLLVVGDGPERLACEGEARLLGLDAAVRFLGQRSDVADILAATDMLALTSICEPFGYVVIEAAALAVPTVAFATGGVPEIVRHEVTGLLVPQDDTEMLAAALIRLVRNRDLARRLGAAAQQQVRRFDLGAHLAALVALYHRLLAVAPKRDSARMIG